jgi:serine/threonine-protein kinase HipA
MGWSRTDKLNFRLIGASTCCERYLSAAVACPSCNSHFGENSQDNPMAIHLVGETIDAKRAHQRAHVSELVQLMRGIHIDQEVDADAVILGHAIRIAHYLYPNASPSQVSAAHVATTPDARLFIRGRRNQRTRLRSLEIIQNETAPHPSTTTAVVGDDLGEMCIDACS